MDFLEKVKAKIQTFSDKKILKLLKKIEPTPTNIKRYITVASFLTNNDIKFNIIKDVKDILIAANVSIESVICTILDDTYILKSIEDPERLREFNQYIHIFASKSFKQKLLENDAALEKYLSKEEFNIQRREIVKKLLQAVDVKTVVQNHSQLLQKYDICLAEIVYTRAVREQQAFLNHINEFGLSSQAKKQIYAILDTKVKNKNKSIILEEYANAFNITVPPNANTDRMRNNCARLGRRLRKI